MVNIPGTLDYNSKAKLIERVESEIYIKRNIKEIMMVINNKSLV